MERSKKTRKVKVVGDATFYSRFIKNCELVKNMDDADIVLFTGGADIDSSCYGKKRHHSTYPDRRRDQEEIAAFRKVRKDQLAVGICRGHQLLAALNGGILVQDVNNHCGGGTHAITNGKEEYQMTSIHHQMVYPYDMPKEDYDVLYWSNCVGTRWEGDGVDPEKIIENGEPEIMVFHKEGMPKCLGIQGHPERIPDSPVSDMINDLIDKLCK